MEDNGEVYEEKPLEEISVEQFEAMCDEIFELRVDKGKQKAALTAVETKLSDLEQKFMAYMEKFGKTEHLGRMGKVTISHDVYPSCPKDGEEREMFFDYLKEKGIFETLITVNPRTLGSFYKQEAEEHKGNPTWEMPGIIDPHTKQKLKATRSKK